MSWQGRDTQPDPCCAKHSNQHSNQTTKTQAEMHRAMQLEVRGRCTNRRTLIQRGAVSCQPPLVHRMVHLQAMASRGLRTVEY